MAYRLQSTSKLLMIALLAVSCGLGTGCQSRQRWAMWSPFSKSPEDESLLARTAPLLPSEVAKAAEKDAGKAAPPKDTSLASAPPFKPTGNLPSLPPSVAAAPGKAPVSPFVTTEAPKAAAVAGKPAGSPYDPNGYQAPAATAVASMPERYGAAATPDRYSSAAMSSAATSPASASPASATPVASYTPPAAVAPAAATADRYATQATTPANIPTGWVIPGQAASPEAAPATQSVAATPKQSIQLPAEAGQYRPGGTSTYPTEVSVANRQGAPSYPTTSTTHGATTPASYR